MTVNICENLHELCIQSDWYKDKAELENSKRSDDADVELLVSNYSCMPAAVDRHQYTLIISARLNAVATRMNSWPQCDIKCQLKNSVNTIINQSRPLIHRSPCYSTISIDSFAVNFN